MIKVKRKYACTRETIPYVFLSQKIYDYLQEYFYFMQKNIIFLYREIYFLYNAVKIVVQFVLDYISRFA